MLSRTVLFFLLIVFCASCKKQDVASVKKIEYYTTVPAQITSISSYQPIAFFNGDIFVASNNGIWKIKMGQQTWTAAGLQGKKVVSVYAHPQIPGKLFAGIMSTGESEKSLFISTDTGRTWQEAPSPLYQNLDRKFETYWSIKARPGHPDQLFADVAGGTIAISKDGGLTWYRQNYRNESYFGYPCPIEFLENKPDEIYIGAEIPLDFAWLGKAIIDPLDPIRISPFEKMVGQNMEWENRRPNCLQSFKTTPGVLYAGLEGALAKIEGTSWKYIYKSDGQNFPYSYITGVWVNPSNKKHLLFGGSVNGVNRSLSVYETFNEGETVNHLSDLLGMQDPMVLSIVATDSNPLILVNERANSNKLHLLWYKYH